MTKYNYTGNISNDIDTIKKMVKELGSGFKNVIRSKSNVQFYNLIIELTNFLPEKSSFNERVYCVINDIHNIQYCNCEHHQKLSFRGTLKKGYSKHCRYCVFDDE